jgi:hypothetical protein
MPFEVWRDTCTTLHAHAQVLGKLAVALAPPEPQLQHAALRLSARGWETPPLPAPDQSGVLVVVLDLHAHHAVVEHSDGRRLRVALTPHRSVGAVTRDLLAGIGGLVGTVQIYTTPQEVSWTVPLDQDEEHATYEPAQVEVYFGAATQAAMVLAELRASYRGRSSPVNAWWGTFDFAVSLFSGRPADPPSDGFITRNSANAEQIEIGWWPGDDRYPHPAFYGYAFPAPAGYETGTVAPAGASWNDELGEYIFGWDEARRAADPHHAAVEFGLSVIRHSSEACRWDPALAASALGIPPPVA